MQADFQKVAEASMDWISVKDERPYEGVEVLATYRWFDDMDIEHRVVTIGTCHHDSCWTDRECDVFAPTHWMPLPAPPKEVK